MKQQKTPDRHVYCEKRRCISHPQRKSDQAHDQILEIVKFFHTHNYVGAPIWMAKTKKLLNC
jgi:hypothetical protein